MTRVNVYVDAMNLNGGLRDSLPRRHRWLDIERLARNLLRADQRLERVKYFTELMEGRFHRRSHNLGRAADAVFMIGAQKIRRALLPETVISPGGVKLRRPDNWV